MASLSPSSAMESDSNISDGGSPEPSVQCRDHHFKQRCDNNFEGLSANAEIERLRRELDDYRQRIDNDTEAINSLHEKITELEALVKKQKITISTQSKTISDRRVLRKHQQESRSAQGMGVFPMTPGHRQHQIAQYQYPGSGGSTVSGSSTGTGAGGMAYVMQNASPSFETPARTHTPQFTRSIEPAPQFGTVFDQPPPKFELPYGASCQAYGPVLPSLASNLGKGENVFSAMSSNVVNGASSTSSTPSRGAAKYHKEMASFSTRFLALMRMSEIFGQGHASLPNIFTDSHLEDHVKDYIMIISSRTHASSLVGNAATRGFFVAKAINWYLIGKLLDITVIKGFNASVDLEINDIQKQITADTPILVRHHLLNAMTTHVVTLSKRPNFAEFIQQKIYHHTTRLWKYVGPLSHHTANQNNTMWIDLNAIITEALSLATDMYSVPLEYRFEFPEHGEPFDPLTMVNRDPYAHGDPQVLQNSDARVRLAITPTVRIRNNSQSPGEVNLMYLSHVLLRVSRRQVP